MLVVIDLENTITNASHRMWMLNSGFDDFSKAQYMRNFQESFIDDDINMNVKLFILSLVKKGHEIVILTAKHVKYRSMVKKWLLEHEIYFDALIMKEDENIGDLEFKERYVQSNRDNIDFALDDVGANCAMFGTYNIPCLRIEQK